MGKNQLILGSIFSGLAVAIGAFGAHALAPIIASHDRQATFDTAVQYHMFHALGIIAVGLLSLYQGSNKQLNWVGYLFSTGVILFSGSLYTMSITGINKLGIITPFGGVLFIAGWTLLIIYLVKNH